MHTRAVTNPDSQIAEGIRTPRKRGIKHPPPCTRHFPLPTSTPKNTPESPQTSTPRLTMMKQDPRLGPLVWAELPRLASRHDADDAPPCVVRAAELGKGLGGVDYEVALSSPTSSCPSSASSTTSPTTTTSAPGAKRGGVGGRDRAVNGESTVTRSSPRPPSLHTGAWAGDCGRLEDRFLEEALDVVHRYERGGGEEIMVMGS
ncbi:hypothetical protein BV22DRAFT_1129630 [Leucogyrophana mollusca]|uniref:Uncharacterized protein n=1 Tax=Leucogyrophana mollusca TaxID=85980 RepID=A0ACB8BFV5_9AGAM|nr:hypothetical protein BV22DRAFT_1129630 [Leucogyrophana mollusca]